MGGDRIYFILCVLIWILPTLDFIWISSPLQILCQLPRPPLYVCATCHIHATCHQTEGKSVCICNYGFVGNGRTHCQDKDECQIGASKICGNHTLCHNTHGSFYCVCLDGYRASNNNKTFIPNDGTNCTDIDECEKSGLCGHNARCVNTEGSYKCYCNDGYKLENGDHSFQPDGNTVSCKEIDCGKPLMIPHTEMIWDNSTTLWSRVYYQCKEGYYFNGDRNFSECTIDQLWENITYICKGKYHCRKLLWGVLFKQFLILVLKVRMGGRMKARNPFLIYKVGNVLVLLVGKVMGENICMRNSNCFHFVFVFLLTEEELLSNLSIFNETCVKWQRKTGRLQVQAMYIVSGQYLRLGVGFFLVSSDESAVKIWFVGFFHILGQRLDEKKFSEDLIFNITTSEDNPKVCLDLKSGSNYVVNITTISSTNITVSVTVAVQTKAFNNVLIFNDTCLKWWRNVRGADVEDRYSFHVQGQRWYQKEFFHEMTFNLTTHKQAPEVCFDLQPGTNYSVNISMVALNFSLTVFVYFLDPPFPDVEFVAVKGSAPLLRLRKAEDRNGPISLYQVIVLPLGLQSTFICDSFTAATFFSNTTDIKGYVAAEFQAKDVADNMSITLGDRHYYGKFYNAPLKLGEEYCVFLRIISEWNKVMNILKPFLYTC
uniref:Sushi domain containing 1 n=1 Tax=Athene cunicularia TaxID=194338 RepID=A0A663N8Y6_ATHCN